MTAIGRNGGVSTWWPRKGHTYGRHKAVLSVFTFSVFFDSFCIVLRLEVLIPQRLAFFGVHLCASVHTHSGPGPVGRFCMQAVLFTYFESLGEPGVSDDEPG